MRREGTLGRMNGAGDGWREDMAMFFFVCIDLGGWKTILYHIKRRKEERKGETRRNPSVALMFRLTD